MTNDRTRRARELRATPTDAERRLWRVLRRGQIAGYIFRRQYPLGRYFVDFVCLPLRLVIEIDGGQHATRRVYDRARDRSLTSRGFRVLRFTDREILTAIASVATVIWTAATEPPPPPSPTRGEGADLESRGSFLTVQHIAPVIEDNHATRAELLEAIDALPPARRREIAFDAWNLEQVLAHLIAWQDGYAAALECIARGERPVVPGFESGIDDGEATDRFNERAVEAASGLSWETLLGRLRAARERHDAAVRALAGRIGTDRFVEGRAAWRLASSAVHDREHIPAILAWRREQGI